MQATAHVHYAITTSRDNVEYESEVKEASGESSANKLSAEPVISHLETQVVVDQRIGLEVSLERPWCNIREALLRGQCPGCAGPLGRHSGRSEEYACEVCEDDIHLGEAVLSCPSYCGFAWTAHELCVTKVLMDVSVDESS